MPVQTFFIAEGKERLFFLVRAEPAENLFYCSGDGLGCPGAGGGRLDRIELAVKGGG